MTRRDVFLAVQAARGGRHWDKVAIDILDQALDQLGVPRDGGAPADDARPVTADMLTARVALELIEHEAIVQEAYRDSQGVWSWGIGITGASGHSVYPRYLDKPQPIQRCVEIFIWLLRNRYVPDVVDEFAGHVLTEAQFAAALSFHYNTGAIVKADWADHWKAGKIEAARTAFMNWNRPSEIIARREKERDLFFDGKWSQDGIAVVFPVSKPSYQPNFRAAKKVDVRADIEAALAGEVML